MEKNEEKEEYLDIVSTKMKPGQKEQPPIPEEIKEKLRKLFEESINENRGMILISRHGDKAIELVSANLTGEQFLMSIATAGEIAMDAEMREKSEGRH